MGRGEFSEFGADWHGGPDHSGPAPVSAHPWYIRGLWAFTLEDQFIVGHRSVVACWTLPRELTICD